MNVVEVFRGHKAIVSLCGFLVGVVCLAMGCGRKGPPKPPRTVTPPSVSDVRAEVDGDRIELSWTIPGRRGQAMEGIKGFDVFRFKTLDPEKMCAGCPVDFRKFEEVKIETAVSDPEDRVTLYDKKEPGYGYMYKVLVLHESGGVSADSNIAKVLP